MLHLLSYFSALKTWLEGKKTYGLGLIGLLVVAANFLGYIDEKTLIQILTLLGLGSLFTIRAAIANQ